MRFARKISNFALAAFAGVAVIAPGSTALGSLPPGFDIWCQVGGGDPWKASDNLGLFGSNWSDAGGQVWNTAPLVGAVWTVTEVFTAYTTNPSQTNALTFTNTSGMTQTYTLTIITPGSLLPGPTIMFGSISGGLTDNMLNGATFATPAGSSAYTAQIDGVSVQTLWDDPFSVSTGSPPYTESLGQAAFNFVPGPGVMTNIAIVHHFTLTAGDSVNLNSAFVVIPGPGGLAVLAAGFLFGRGRRRP